MYLLKLLVFLLYAFESQQEAIFWDGKYNRDVTGNEAYDRLREVMRGYYEDANARIASMNDMRFMFEESPHYEMGYVVSEIIERYRKVVGQAQIPFKFGVMNLFDMIKYLEIVQKLYFEIYHLVRMVHEIPRKYASMPEFVDIESVAGPDVGVEALMGKKKKTKYQDQMKKNLADLHKRREKELAKQRKKFRRLRKKFLEGQIGSPKGYGNKPYNQFWPLDYGWEIDYYW